MKKVDGIPKGKILSHKFFVIYFQVSIQFHCLLLKIFRRVHAFILMTLLLLDHVASYVSSKKHDLKHFAYKQFLRTYFVSSSPT